MHEACVHIDKKVSHTSLSGYHAGHGSYAMKYCRLENGSPDPLTCADNHVRLHFQYFAGEIGIIRLPCLASILYASIRSREFLAVWYEIQVNCWDTGVLGPLQAFCMKSVGDDERDFA